MPTSARHVEMWANGEALRHPALGLFTMPPALHAATGQSPALTERALDDVGDSGLWCPPGPRADSLRHPCDRPPSVARTAPQDVPWPGRVLGHAGPRQLDRLRRWYRDLRKHAFYGAPSANAAGERLRECGTHLEAFAANGLPALLFICRRDRLSPATAALRAFVLSSRSSGTWGG